MADPLVTVVVPTYNCAQTLRVALQSVLSQDFVDFEVWVVGDGCTDESESVVAEMADARVHWINLPENSGTPSLPRNEALRRARGRYVAYLGHDDLWFPWHLSSLVGALANGGDFVYSVGVCCGRLGVDRPFTLPVAVNLWTAVISPSNWMHARNLPDRAGFWSTQVDKGVDREFLLQARMADIEERFVSRLSVIKFPSIDWEIYRPGMDRPQFAWFEAMRRDPIRLEQRVLTDIAACLASSSRPLMAREAAHSDLSTALRLLRAWLLTSYGRHRWPVRSILRRRALKARGLRS